MKIKILLGLLVYIAGFTISCSDSGETESESRHIDFADTLEVKSTSGKKHQKEKTECEYRDGTFRTNVYRELLMNVFLNPFGFPVISENRQIAAVSKEQIESYTGLIFTSSDYYAIKGMVVLTHGNDSICFAKDDGEIYSIYLTDQAIRLRKGLSIGMTKTEFIDSFVKPNYLASQWTEKYYPDYMEDSSFINCAEKDIVTMLNKEEDIFWTDGCIDYTIEFENGILITIKSEPFEC